MPNYRRANTEGATYFFTVVTCERQKILTDPRSIDAMRAVLKQVKNDHPFRIDAWVTLPDHIHSIWTLPKGDGEFSKRWGMIKAKFSKNTKGLFNKQEWISESKFRRRETSIWQRRFWEHQIRDEEDLRKHMDYLHYNPVKHGLVQRVKEWSYSTFHRYVEQGFYTGDWGAATIFDDGEFGE